MLSAIIQRLVAVCVGGTLLMMGTAAYSDGGGASSNSKSAETLNVGFTTTWSISANVVQTLAHTDIPKENGLKINPIGFVAGGPVASAFLSGQVDIGVIGDGPAFSAIAADPSTRIIGLCQHTRGAVLVAPKSNIKSFDDLAGKRVGAFVSSSAWALFETWVGDARMKPQPNVINLQPQSWLPALTRKSIDAFVAWDPWIALAESKEEARVLKAGIDPGCFMVVKDSLLKKRRAEIVRFVAAYQEALFYGIQNKKQVYGWVAGPARMSVDAVRTASEAEPLWHAKSIEDVQLSIPDSLLKYEDKAVDLLISKKFLKSRPDWKIVIDKDVPVAAQKYIEDSGFSVAKVKVVRK